MFKSILKIYKRKLLVFSHFLHSFLPYFLQQGYWQSTEMIKMKDKLFT